MVAAVAPASLFYEAFLLKQASVQRATLHLEVLKKALVSLQASLPTIHPLPRRTPRALCFPFPDQNKKCLTALRNPRSVHSNMVIIGLIFGEESANGQSGVYFETANNDFSWVKKASVSGHTVEWVLSRGSNRWRGAIGALSLPRALCRSVSLSLSLAPSVRPDLGEPSCLTGL